MKSNHYSPELLADWFQSAKGDQFISSELSLVERAVKRLFGTHCAISSVYSHEALLQQIPCRRLYNVIQPGLDVPEHVISPVKSIQSSIDCLPFPEDSLDGFILLHTLDCVANPHDAIREVARVIRPGGQVILVGFNPASVLGWSRYMPGLRQQAPVSARFLGRQRLCDWLALLHFEVEYLGGSRLYPFRNNQHVNVPETRRQLAEGSVWRAARVGLGKTFRERYGGIYCIRVRKTHTAGTLVGAIPYRNKSMWIPANAAAISREPYKD